MTVGGEKDSRSRDPAENVNAFQGEPLSEESRDNTSAAVDVPAVLARPPDGPSSGPAGHTDSISVLPAPNPPGADPVSRSGCPVRCVVSRSMFSWTGSSPIWSHPAVTVRVLESSL
jgi:hypothetical protein